MMSWYTKMVSWSSKIILWYARWSHYWLRWSTKMITKRSHSLDTKMPTWVTKITSCSWHQDDFIFQERSHDIPNSPHDLVRRFHGLLQNFRNLTLLDQYNSEFFIEILHTSIWNKRDKENLPPLFNTAK